MTESKPKIQLFPSPSINQPELETQPQIINQPELETQIQVTNQRDNVRQQIITNTLHNSIHNLIALDKTNPFSINKNRQSNPIPAQENNSDSMKTPVVSLGSPLRDLLLIDRAAEIERNKFKKSSRQ